MTIFLQADKRNLISLYKDVFILINSVDEMEITRFSKALSDEIRVRLLAMLRTNELNVGEVVQILGMSQPRVSRHLKILHESGLLESRREGLWNFYKLVSEGAGRRYARSLDWLLDEAPQVARDNEMVEQVLAERHRETREFFDEIAEDWDLLQREVFGEFDLNAEILSCSTDCGVGADLGCGNGALVDQMLTSCGSVIGVDSSKRMLELASERVGSRPEVSLRIGDLSYLPLRDQEADFSVISMVLHHLPQPEMAVSEAYRTLSKGGKFVIADFAMHSNESMRTEYGDRRLGFTEEELMKWMSDSGFESIEIKRFPVNKGLTVLVVSGEK